MIKEIIIPETKSERIKREKKVKLEKEKKDRKITESRRWKYSEEDTNKEKQIIAIAEFCGWSQDEVLGWWAPDDSEWYGTSWGIDMLPDYLNDLNAMHDAEKMLFKFGPKDSNSIVANRMHDYAEALGYDIHATAEQRAEALLKTIGRWEDESEQV